MKPATFACFGLFALGVLLFLAQVWFAPFSAEAFFKVMLTVGALFVLSVVYVFLVRENKASEKIDNGNSNSLN